MYLLTNPFMNSLTYYFRTTMNIVWMQNVWRGRKRQTEIQYRNVTETMCTQYSKPCWITSRGGRDFIFGTLWRSLRTKFLRMFSVWFFFDCDTTSLTCALSSFELSEFLRCVMTGPQATHAEGSAVTVAEVIVLSLGLVCFHFWYHYT